MKTAWIVVKEGLLKGRVLEKKQQGEDAYSVIIEAENGTKYDLHSRMPNGEFYPSFYIQEEEPNLWRFGGRSLLIRSFEEFEEPESAMSLVPLKVPYKFLPHTSKIIDGIINGDPQFLVGPKGTGKTSVVEQIAARINQPCPRVNINHQMMMSDLVGQVGIAGGETVWQDSYVPMSMRKGYWLILDEFPFMDPGLASHFYPILENPPTLTLKEKPGGEIIKPKPSWRIFATGNALGEDDEYVGQQQINIALLDRFSAGQIIEVEPMSSRQELDVLRKRLPWAPDNVIKRILRISDKIRGGGSGPYPTLSTRQIINWVKKTVLNKSYIVAAEATWMPLVKEKDREEAVKIASRCGRVIIGRSIVPTRVEMQDTPSQMVPSIDMQGMVASQVEDPAWIKAIHDAHEAGMYFHAVEKHFNLRRSEGNTARRLWKKHKEAPQVA